MKVPSNINTIFIKGLENNLACLDWDRGVIADTTVLHNRSDITLYEKTDQMAYLFDVSVQNSGNLQTVYTKKIRKYAKLSTEVKNHSQIEAVCVYLTCQCICKCCHFSHIA